MYYLKIIIKIEEIGVDETINQERIHILYTKIKPISTKLDRNLRHQILVVILIHGILYLAFYPVNNQYIVHDP